MSFLKKKLQLNFRVSIYHPNTELHQSLVPDSSRSRRSSSPALCAATSLAPRNERRRWPSRAALSRAMRHRSSPCRAPPRLSRASPARRRRSSRRRVHEGALQQCAALEAREILATTGSGSVQRVGLVHVLPPSIACLPTASWLPTCSSSAGRRPCARSSAATPPTRPPLPTATTPPTSWRRTKRARARQWWTQTSEACSSRSSSLTPTCR